MVVTKIKDNGKITLKLIGKLGVTTSSQLQEILDEIVLETNKVELNLRDLTHLSSAGMRVFLLMHNELKSKGGLLTISNVPLSIKSIFDTSGFGQFLVFIDNP